MKTTSKPRFSQSLTVIAVIALLGVLSCQAKTHVDLQFWDMVWGPPEYIDTGKALVAQFNQEHPDITVTYRSIPWASLMTAATLGVIPTLMLFFCIQRYMVSGATAGAIKG